MRVSDAVSYLSPSSLALFEYNKADWYKRYVLKEKFKPTTAMLMGTMFDHLCKTALGYVEVRPPEWHVLTVDQQKLVRDVYERYVAWGGLADTLSRGKGLILESTLTGEINGVPLLGKPDLYGDDLLADGSAVVSVRDWKTSGFVASKPPSPPKGYVWDSKTLMGHKDYRHDGGVTHFGPDMPYGAQLHTYGMLLRLKGKDVQILDAHWVTPTRFAKYRYRFNDEYAESLAVRYRTCWDSDLDRVRMLV